MRKPVTTFDALLSDKDHQGIEANGAKRVTADDGRIFYIMPGGTFDGEQWAHQVLPAEEVPHQ